MTNAYAQLDLQSILPPRSAVEKALHQLPEIMYAYEGIAEEEANKKSLNTGGYEWMLRAGAAQRRDKDALLSYTESHASIERAFRWPSKVRADNALGVQGVEVAESVLADTWHEMSRELLSMWFAYLKTHAVARHLLRQKNLLDQQYISTEQRIRRGEVARIEALQVDLDRDKVETSYLQALQQAKLAFLNLSERFYGIEMIEPHFIPEPISFSREERSVQVETILLGNHEIELASRLYEQAKLRAERADKDRLPDPSVSAYVSRERMGREHLLGMSVAMPLPSAYRDARYAASLAKQNMEQQHLELIKMKVRSNAVKVVENVVLFYDVWKASQQGLLKAERQADLLMRSYTLGEARLAEVLLAYRQLIESTIAAESARLDALEAYARVILDSHKLWPFEHQELKEL